MIDSPSPADVLKAHNWAQWCKCGETCRYFCKFCKMPIDSPEVIPGVYSKEPDCCLVCCDLVLILERRAYWTNLRLSENVRRKQMGLDDTSSL